MKRTTIKDIAQRLGVNPSTVSRALKDHPDIGLALRLEIQRVAAELHYRPNQMAVQLRQRQRKLIGLIVPELTMFFYHSVMKGINEVLDQHGYHLVMLVSNESTERELENIRICGENDLAGILFALTRYTQGGELQQVLEELDVPVVLFDKVLAGLPYHAVILADVDAACQAVEHLTNTGCKRIGGIFGNPGLLITQLRVEGFRKGLAAAGLPFEPAFLQFADSAMEAAQCAATFLEMPQPPDAIFAMSDETILGAMPVIAGAGLRIPEDCSVICISDGFLPYCLRPQVTYLHHDGSEIGKIAAGKLIDLIENNQTAVAEIKTDMLQARLVELNTTRRQPIHI